jgi:hypothetical protein
MGVQIMYSIAKLKRDWGGRWRPGAVRDAEPGEVDALGLTASDFSTALDLPDNVSFCDVDHAGEKLRVYRESD